MKKFIFRVCDVFGSFSRTITIENVEDLSCAMHRLDNYIHDDEYLLDYKEVQ